MPTHVFKPKRFYVLRILQQQLTVTPFHIRCNSHVGKHPIPSHHMNQAVKNSSKISRGNSFRFFLNTEFKDYNGNASSNTSVFLLGD
jgi:hypothetical protein